MHACTGDVHCHPLEFYAACPRRGGRPPHPVFPAAACLIRMASMAIFNDIAKDEQYRSRLTRKSAITALCMYDREDVDAAQRTPGDFPNIDLL